MRAAIFGHVDLVRLLVAAGADVRLQDKLGLTAREWADRRGYSEIAELLSNVRPPEILPSPKSAPPEEARSKLAAERNLASEEESTFHQTRLSGTEEQSRPVVDRLSEAEQRDRPSSTEPTIAAQDDGLKWIKFHQRIIAENKRSNAEKLLQSSATETTIESPNKAPEGTDEQVATKSGPEPLRVEQETAGTTESRAIAARIKHQRVLEESRQRVEAKRREHSQQAEPMGTERGNPVVETGSISAGAPDIIGLQLDRAESDMVQETPSSEYSTGAAMLEPITSELNSPERKRCPQCNATYRNPLLAYCAYDATKLVRADDPLPLINSPAPTDWSRPTLWALVAIIAVLGGTLGYLINSYLSSREKPSTAPVATKIEQPEKPRENLPTIEGALSGMEVDVPKPEYPEQARSEGVTGTIAVRVQVNRKGRVISARSSSGDRRLRAAAVKAALKATFSEEKLGGRGEKGTITYVFAL
jgi:TonB family protein